MRHNSDLSASLAAATLFCGLSRRRHIDLQRFTGCLCPG
ncbi:putative leader peptide [Actinacidiphila glaucinigra]|nr:putative leader peptide [Actinacidiphila glaucinigra]